MKRITPSSAGPTESSGGSAESNEPGPISPPGKQEDSTKSLPVPPILLEGDDPLAKPTTGSPETRFSPPVTYAKAPEQPGEFVLPSSYGTGQLVLTARDPHCLYAHWDRPVAGSSPWPEAALTLRVHQESLDGPLAGEHPIAPDAQHAFVPVESRASRYVAELGYYPSEGNWRALASSGPAPALGLASAPAQQELFATMPFPMATTTIPSAPGPIHVSEQPTFAGAIAPEQALTQIRGEPSQVEPPVSIAHLEFPLVRTLPFTGEPVVSEAEPIILESEEEMEIEVSGHTSAMPAAAAPWGTGQQRALAELIGWSLIRYRGLSSIDLEALTRGEWTLTTELVPSEVSPLGAAEISSEALNLAPVAQPRGFWLNVNAELVIYGATEPGSNVVIGGRPIKLRPDGSFSYRFSLPDGSYQLPIQATSQTGQPRGVTLDFSRKTSATGTVGVHPQDPGLVPPQ